MCLVNPKTIQKFVKRKKNKMKFIICNMCCMMPEHSAEHAIA